MRQRPSRLASVKGRPLRIGCGAGYANDRVEPAIELVERGDLDVLVFECLAERTIALAQQAKARDPQAGFDPRLRERMEAVLAGCHQRGVTLITNMGAANPHAAALCVRDVARHAGLTDLTIAVVTGDDVATVVCGGPHRCLEQDELIDPASVVSANAYLGADPVIEAIRGGADVIITGRVADPSLFVAPILTTFGWASDDWPRVGLATLAGHLLECAGQVTGGYFADPGVKDVPHLERLGFPLAEISADGAVVVVTKVSGSGGLVTTATCTEQLLYEVHDPAAYVTPDVVADFSGVTLVTDGVDRVRVSGASGRPRPAMLKVSVGQYDGWIGEGQISYGGPGAVARARLAAGIVAARLQLVGLATSDIRYDLMGVDALHAHASRSAEEPYEVRLRVAARVPTEADAWRVAREVEALYTNGPAGGGGATTMARPVLAMRSTLVPRSAVAWRVDYETV